MYTIYDILDCVTESTYNEIFNKDNYITEGVELVIPITVIGGIIIHGVNTIKKDIRNTKQKEIVLKRQNEETEKRTVEDIVSKINLNKNKFILNGDELKLDSKSDIFNMISKDVRTIVNFIKSDSEYKNKIKTSIDTELSKYKKDLASKRMSSKIFDDWVKSYNEDLNDYRLISKSEVKSGSLLITIIDGTQESQSTLWFIITDIAKVIKMKYKNVLKVFDLIIDTGDGDEGSLYITTKK